MIGFLFRMWLLRRIWNFITGDRRPRAARPRR